MIRNVLVLGGGSAGFLAAITLKHRLPQLKVTVIRSKEIGIIGVGESTTIPLVTHLHEYLRMDLSEFYRMARPTHKLAIRFLWGPRPYFDYGLNFQLDLRYVGLSKPVGYYSGDALDFGRLSALMTLNKVFFRLPDGRPAYNRDPAYHLQNAYFVEFLERYAERQGVEIRDDTVVHVPQNDAGIAGLVLASGATLTADLYVDCSGFRSLLLGQTLSEPFVSFKPSLFCNRAVIGPWVRTDEPIKPYTTAETMNAGWCWQIEHEDRVDRGYVYSSDFISDDAAEREFREKNPKATTTRVVKFVSGRRERSWVKNVVAIGNASSFVEPLESTAVGVICLDSFALAESLADSDLVVRPTQVQLYNRRAALTVDLVRRFLAVHYKFNTRLQTPFWRACVADVDLFGAEEYVEFYKENGPSTLWRQMILDGRDPFGFEGYLSMMIGMDVPYRRTFAIPEHEQWAWAALFRRWQEEASQALTVEETLRWIRSPGWQWPMGLFAQT
jgi:tryptophan 7-halogenase